MEKEELINELTIIVSPYAQDAEALAHIQEDTDFIRDLKINSANLVDVVLDVEEKFGIEIDNDSMARMLTVKAAIRIIEEKLAAGAGK
ncbi:phosphopantetheine-binding protein [Pedobacter sp. MC2016-15]|uniref:acyl carrier protein n=1 Tax=Pedobacter sp. MC2016-15 TaxID=2994473 RepID=UPI0022481C7A|nr:phosphopantetheine-binding protein [Pedobacter sp. MC2016-15]MCX2480419.1 phosphopantetheine-binding protein [Pedobacter sp. MC2016-15]